MSGPILAVDIGATKFSAGVVTAVGDVLARFDTPATGEPDPERVYGRLRSILERALASAPAPPLACGIGSAGPLTREGLVSPLNLPAWRDFALVARLAADTGLRVAIDLDAKALALGERWRGAAAGEDDFLAMVVSTGVGGGIVLNGRLLDGALGNAGHIGHVIVVDPAEGHLCGCGARGCLEAEASGTAIAAFTGRPAAAAPPAVIERTGTLVGRGVASVCNLLDLRLAVVAGSVALGYGAPFFAAAQAELDRQCRLSFSTGARIVPAGLGADGPLVGAAAVAIAHGLATPMATPTP